MTQLMFTLAGLCFCVAGVLGGHLYLNRPREAHDEDWERLVGSTPLIVDYPEDDDDSYWRRPA